MDKIVASDHPDCAGGIVWSSCELRWINSKIEQQAERIRELLAINDMNAKAYPLLQVKCDALAAQNQLFRAGMLNVCNGCRIWGGESERARSMLEYYLAFPDLATPIINELKAKTLEDAAQVFQGMAEDDGADRLRRMAQELRSK